MVDESAVKKERRMTNESIPNNNFSSPTKFNKQRKKSTLTTNKKEKISKTTGKIKSPKKIAT